MLPNASGQVTRLSTENPEFGRITIYTDEKQITAANVVAVLQNALKIHEQNATRIEIAAAAGEPCPAAAHPGAR